MATIRRLGLVVLVAGAICAPATAALAATPGPPLAPGIGVRLLQAPAGSADNPRAHEYIVDHVVPGTTISRQIGFSNGEAQPVHLSFYAVTATIKDGIFLPGVGRTSNELTGWTTFSPTSADIAPGQTLPVTVTIRVPADATSGERYAAALGDDTPLPAAGGGITSVSRVGIRIYLSVGTGGAPATTFTVDSMTATRDATGHPVVTADVHNTGGRAVDLSGQLEMTNGPSSLSAGPFATNAVATLAPGQSGHVSILLDSILPDGPWDARLTLVSGVTSATATGRLTFPSARGASAAPTVNADAALPRHGRLSTVVAGAVAAALLLLLGTFLFWFSRRRRTPPAGLHAAP